MRYFTVMTCWFLFCNIRFVPSQLWKCTHQASKCHERKIQYMAHTWFLTFFTPHILKLYAFLSLSNITRNVVSQSFVTRWLMFCIQIIRISLCVYSLHAIASDPLQIQFVSKFVFFSVFPVRMWLGLPHSPHYPLAEMTWKQHWLLWELGKASPFPFFPNMLFLLLPECALSLFGLDLPQRPESCTELSVLYSQKSVGMTFFLLLFWLFIIQTACWKHWNASPLWHMQKQH